MRPPDFWSRNDFAARATAAALSPLGWLYGASVAFKHSRTTPWRAKAEIVCVGNLTAGGSGKTPVAIAIGRALLARGTRVGFLTRGYGGRMAGPLMARPDAHDASEVGDEPLLLAATAPTIVARNRKTGALFADAQGLDVLVMDDGYQNFALEKDLSIVVVDGESGFGNRQLLPAGPLREPVGKGLARADAVIVVGNGTPDLADWQGPLLRARLLPDNAMFSGSRVVAFAGIGRPEKFFATLRDLGADVVEARAFDDHHPYTAEEISALKARAQKLGAVLVTTEKDLMRLNAADRDGISALAVHATFDVPAELERLLDRIAKPTHIRP